MAVGKAQIKSQYPLPAYNYRVSILPASAPGAPGGGGNLLELTGASAVIGCSEITGLNMELETATYRHGYSFLTGMHIIPGQRKEVQLSLKRGVTASSPYFSDWMSLVYPILAPPPAGSSRKRDLLIDLCDEQGEPLVRWMVLRAMPTRLEAPTFDANTNEVAFERLDLIAHELKIEYLNTDNP